ncbi:choice-of-anchor D domain-containing protein [Solirubrobacter taibaiensis]|nr:choice-of-anchor D domain-containing protein [Solirubrobacter taibaiensis]
MRPAGLIAIILTALLVAPAPAQAASAPGWAPTGAMAVPRYLHSAVLLDDGRVLVAGGQALGGLTDVAELYDPATGTWSRAGSLLEARAGAMTIKLRTGRVLIVGGHDGTRGIDTAEVYDPTTNTWTGAGSMTVGRYYPAITMLADGRVLVAGGADGPTWSTTASVYNPRTNVWESAGTFSGESPHAGAAVTLADGRVLVAGGYGGNGASRTARFFGGGTAWSLAADMTTPRFTMTLDLLPNGHALAVGGENNGAHLNTAETFDGSQWQLTGPMHAAHDRHAATMLVNGQVLVTGGWSGTGGTTAVERYASATRSWLLEAPLGIGRWHHTATRLADGRVLVAAGGDPAGSLTATAELWTPATTLTSDPAYAFMDTAAGAATAGVVQLTNTGDQPLLADDFTLAGAQPGEFTVDGARCRQVAPGATCLLGVGFAPTGVGPRTATLTLKANTAATLHAIPLSGRGLPAAGGDADGDGVVDSADRCATLRGPVSRSGCPAGLLADPSIRYSRSGKGIRVVAYYVKATTGARVTVKCSKGCKRTVTKGRGSRRVRVTRLNGKRLAHNAKITITVSMPNRLTTTVTDRISRGRRIEGRPRCTPVGC